MAEYIAPKPIINAPFRPDAAPRESFLTFNTLDNAIGEMKPLDSPIRKNGPKIFSIFSGKIVERANERDAPKKLDNTLEIRIFRSVNIFKRYGLSKLPIMKPDVMIIRRRELWNELSW